MKTKCIGICWIPENLGGGFQITLTHPFQETKSFYTKDIRTMLRFASSSCKVRHYMI